MDDQTYKATRKVDLIQPKFFALNCKHLSPSTTYERYLIEVLNGSLLFFTQKRTRFEQFQLVKEQSSGESDASSSLYSIDFKLLVDQDVMNALSKNKPIIDTTYQKEGIIIVNEKRDKSPVPANNILFDLMELNEEDVKLGNVSASISNLLTNLKKEKNIFLYYPYEFVSEEDYPGDSFEWVLNKALKVTMDFRTKVQPQKDTFVCIKANKWFLIYEWTSKGFMFRDRVNEVQCGHYLDVKTYALY